MYVSVSIRRGKGAWYAVLTRWGPYDFGRLPGDVARLSDDAGERWHTIEVTTAGAHVQATVDGSIALAFSFPQVGGRPIAVGEQNSETRLASNWGPDVFQRGGQIGLATRKATARFEAFEVEDLPEGTVIRTPYNPEYDESGRILPRWPYDWIMRNCTEWFLKCRDLVTAVGGSREAENAGLDKMMEETGWPPYIFSWALVVDDMGFDAPTQFPTHNVHLRFPGSSSTTCTAGTSAALPRHGYGPTG